MPHITLKNTLDANGSVREAKKSLALLRLAVDKQLQRIDTVAEREAMSAVQRIKDNIARGKIRPFNAPEYAAWKKRTTGRRPRALLFSGEYMAAITYERVGLMQYRVTVGDGTHQGSGLPMQMLANILEHGTTDGIPARPHIGPVCRQAAGRVRVSVRKILKQSK